MNAGYFTRTRNGSVRSSTSTPCCGRARKSSGTSMAARSATRLPVRLDRSADAPPLLQLDYGLGAREQDERQQPRPARHAKWTGFASGSSDSSLGKRQQASELNPRAGRRRRVRRALTADHPVILAPRPSKRAAGGGAGLRLGDRRCLPGGVSTRLVEKFVRQVGVRPREVGWPPDWRTCGLSLR